MVGMIGRISLLHATYRAGQIALEGRDAWLARAGDPEQIEHIFAFDADDELSAGFDGVASPPRDGVTAVRNWNAAAAVATGDLLVTIADDLLPCEGWDT